MTLHANEQEVGVRELHDRLSEYLESVEKGVDIVVTRRGKRIARLTAVDREDPFDDLVARGLVRLPLRRRQPLPARVQARGSVSELVKDQRR